MWGDLESRMAASGPGQASSTQSASLALKVLLRQLSAQGMTVLLSSHQMADVEQLCNRVAVINRGGILYEGAIGDLTGSAGTWYHLRASHPERALAVGNRLGLERLEANGDGLHFTADQAPIR